MKLNFILDLDQTIISSEELKGKHKSADSVKFKFNTDKEKTDIDSRELICHHQLDQYIIVERPGLQDFLDYLFKNFNVSVWTAASKEYARFICRKIILPKNKPERKLNYFLYVEHCQMSTGCHKENIKNLKFLYNLDKNFNEKNTILLDDSEEHIKYQKGQNSRNIIKAKEYFFLEKKEDDFLPQLVEQLKKWKNEDARNIVKNINKYFKN